MLDDKVASSVSANVAMSVMLGLRLPDVVIRREREPLRGQSQRRSDFGMRGSDGKQCGQRQTVAFLD
jgi:hypothetical protein